MITKEALKEQCLREISQKLSKIEEAQMAIQEALENETKSSAGDKFETSRALLQQQEDQYTRQTIHWTQQLAKLKSIDFSQVYNRVEEGSLVFTADNVFFISIALGKIKLEEQNVYAISKESPIGKLLFKGKKGDTISFRDKIYKILEIR